MTTLQDIIRSRLTIQLGEDSTRQLRLDEALTRSIWIAGDYGLISRTGGTTRSPLKRLSETTTIKLPINRTYRYLHTSIVSLLYLGHHYPVQDTELFAAVSESGIDKTELAQVLEMSVRQLNYRVRKEELSWNLLKQDDLIIPVIAVITEPPTSEDLILRLLKSYPYSTVDQLEFLSGLHRSELVTPINNLVRREEIVRGITRIDAPDELFLGKNFNGYERDEFPVCVFEKRDAFIEHLKLERYFDHRNADYWIFIDGLPQAEFDLERVNRSVMQVRNLSRFITTTYQLADLLDYIQQWGRNQRLDLHIDQVDDELTTAYREITQLLLDRGYELADEQLVLDRIVQQKREEQSVILEDIPVQQSRQPQVLSWNLIGSWVKNRQLLDYSGTEAEVVHALGQIDSIESIAYRLSRNPERLWLEDVVYIPGINHRMGFVHVNDIEDIVRGWPRQVKPSFIDNKIIAQLDSPKLTDEILTLVGESPMTVKQRLRYLEKTRVIRKQLPGSIHINHCVWIRFDDGLPSYNKPVGGKRSMASVGTFMLRSLETNPPLTKDQLSRFLGLSMNELEPLLSQYVKSNRILEGYFMAGLGDIQYTLPDVLDTLPVEIADIDTSASQRVDILPISDPYAVFHLLPLVLNDPTIQPTRPYAETSEQWMVCWDGEPVGYFIKEPSIQPMVDFELDLKITQAMVTTPIIAGTLQKIVTIFRTWYDDECKLMLINGIPPSDDRWKDIQFLIASIGIVID